MVRFDWARCAHGAQIDRLQWSEWGVTEPFALIAGLCGVASLRLLAIGRSPQGDLKSTGFSFGRNVFSDFSTNPPTHRGFVVNLARREYTAGLRTIAQRRSDSESRSFQWRF